jgi:hypothetical protein
MDTPNRSPSIPTPPTDPLEPFRGRMQEALASIFANLERTRTPAPFRLILAGLRPRLAASLDSEPERAAAILVWAWTQIPQMLGDAVDLTDTDRVLAIARRVEELEFGREPAATS